MNLAKLTGAFRFCLLAGVEEVCLDEESVAGRWTKSLTPFWSTENVRPTQDFLNWSSAPESIVLFTKRFGPLNDEPKPGDGFRFHLSEWRGLQKRLRLTWNDVRLGKTTGDWEASPGDGVLAYQNGQLVFTARSLFSFLCLDLVTNPVKLMKLCLRPGCPAPFFMAHHARQRFCSEKCSGWSQRISKTIWWKRNGEKWRRKRNRLKARKRGRVRRGSVPKG
jgi:hypothetical protein